MYDERRPACAIADTFPTPISSRRADGGRVAARSDGDSGESRRAARQAGDIGTRLDVDEPMSFEQGPNRLGLVVAVFEQYPAGGIQMGRNAEGRTSNSCSSDNRQIELSCVTDSMASSSARRSVGSM